MRQSSKVGTWSMRGPARTSMRLAQVGQFESSKSAMYTLAPELSALITCHNMPTGRRQQEERRSGQNSISITAAAMSTSRAPVKKHTLTSRKLTTGHDWTACNHLAAQRRCGQLTPCLRTHHLAVGGAGDLHAPVHEVRR